MDKNMEKEHIIIKIMIFILENGLKIKKMVMVSYNILIKQYMMVNGLMINHVIKDKSYIPIKINIKVNIYIIFRYSIFLLLSGNFLNGKKHGNGIYHYSTGGKYKGEWLNDQKNGYGVI